MNGFWIAIALLIIFFGAVEKTPSIKDAIVYNLMHEAN